MIEFHFVHIAQKKTYAVNLLTEIQLDEIAIHLLTGTQPDVILKYGVAKVHPLDRFCKKTGREVALDNLQQGVFKAWGLNVSENGTYFHFRKDKLNFKFYKSHKRSLGRIVDAYEYA